MYKCAVLPLMRIMPHCNLHYCFCYIVSTDAIIRCVIFAATTKKRATANINIPGTLALQYKLSYKIH